MLWKWQVFLPVSSSLFSSSFILVLWPVIKDHAIWTRKSTLPGGIVRCTIYRSRSRSSSSTRTSSNSCSKRTLPYTRTWCCWCTHTVSGSNSGRTIWREPQQLAQKYYQPSTHQIQTLFIVCIPCNLADGSDKKILSRYPFTSRRWIQHFMSSFQKHQVNVESMENNLKH